MDAFDGFLRWANKPLKSMLTTPSELHQAVAMASTQKSTGTSKGWVQGFIKASTQAKRTGAMVRRTVLRRDRPAEPITISINAFEMSPELPLFGRKRDLEDFAWVSLTSRH